MTSTWLDLGEKFSNQENTWPEIVNFIMNYLKAKYPDKGTIINEINIKSEDDSTPMKSRKDLETSHGIINGMKIGLGVKIIQNTKERCRKIKLEYKDEKSDFFDVHFK